METVHTTVNTSGAEPSPASGAGDDIKAQLQGHVIRTKAEVTEAMLTKTGTIVQRRITQGVHEAKVVMEKVH